MKKVINSVVFIFLFSFYLFIPRTGADTKLPLLDIEPEISMDFKDAGLKDILKVFSIQSGLNFIASEAVQDRKITLYLDRVPLKEAMDDLFKANNLSYDYGKDSNIFIVKDWGKTAIDTVTKVFYLKYATVSSSTLLQEVSSNMGATSGFGVGGSSGGGGSANRGDSGITQAVKQLLSQSGSVIEDFRTNSLIVTDTPNRMEVISKVIASLDVPAPQVILEVEMLDVSKNVVDKMGFNFADAGSYSIQVASAQKPTSFPLHGFDNPRGSVTNGTLTFPTTLKVMLDFLRTQTDTKFLARPKLLTLNNETAEIRIATNESIGVTTTAEASTASTSATPERTETGVILRVTPQINTETGEITMFVYPKVAEAVAGNTITTGGGNYAFRDPEERSTKTVVRIKDGETVIIGGLIRNEFNEVKTQVPILGDIPIIGALFRHRGSGTNSPAKNKQRELLVFITPHIVKDTNTRLAQTNKITFPFQEREQNTSSGLSRESEINDVLNSFEKKSR